MTGADLAPLAQLRAASVDTLRRELAQCRDELTRAEQALAALQRAHAELARRRLALREASQRAHDVAGLRAVAGVERALSVEERGLLRELAACTARVRALTQAVAQAERPLLDAELGRRAVAQVVERRARDAAVRRDRTEDDASDELVRTRG